jgi:ketosteroid isomerase-like protein
LSHGVVAAVPDIGDEIIIECEGHHRRTADGTPVDIGCVWFITGRDGLVTYFRDYMNPVTRSTHQS